MQRACSVYFCHYYIPLHRFYFRFDFYHYPETYFTPPFPLCNVNLIFSSLNMNVLTWFGFRKTLCSVSLIIIHYFYFFRGNIIPSMLVNIIFTSLSLFLFFLYTHSKVLFLFIVFCLFFFLPTFSHQPRLP